MYKLRASDQVLLNSVGSSCVSSGCFYLPITWNILNFGTGPVIMLKSRKVGELFVFNMKGFDELF